MEVLMTHAMGIKMAHSPILRPLVYFSFIAGDVKQGTVRVSGFSSQFTPLSPSL